MFEIASSKIVAEKNDTKDKDFADHMIQDHTKTTQELKKLVDSGKVKVDLPSTMNKSNQERIAKLQGLNGDDFRKEYERLQVSTHKDAVSLFERYGKSGSDPELKDFANKFLPTIQAHLKMAQELEK